MSNPIDSRKAKNRDAVFSATLSLIEELSYHNCTVEKIATRAGVGKPTIYKYWGNKSPIPYILYDIVKENNDFASYCERASQDKSLSTRARLKHLLNYFLKLCDDDNLNIIPILFASSIIDPDFEKAFMDEFLGIRKEFFYSIMKEGIEKKEVSANTDLFKLWDFLFGFLSTRIVLKLTKNKKSDVDDFLDMLGL